MVHSFLGCFRMLFFSGQNSSCQASAKKSTLVELQDGVSSQDTGKWSENGLQVRADTYTQCG